MALPAGRYGVTKNQLLKIKKLPMNTIKLIEELTEKFDLLGTAAFKNSTSVVTSSSDLVESGAVKDIVGWGNKNKIRYPYVDTNKSANNITFTDNGDGSVTISTPSGYPASAQTSFTLNNYYMEGAEAIRNDLLNSGDLLISGGLSDDVFVYFYHPYEIGGSVENRSGDNEFTFTRENGDWNVSIIVANGADLSTPVTVKPMIRKKGTSDTYEPYHASVEESLAQKCENTVIAPVENGSTASQAYTVGEHFIRDGAFCTCKQAISSGGTLTEGTNYTSGDVAGALKGTIIDTMVTNLSNIPFGNGVITIGSAISPTGGDLTIRYIRFGDSDNSFIICGRASTGVLYTNCCYNGTWSTWKIIDTSTIS